MEKRKPPLSIRIFYWLMSFATAMMAIVFIAAIVFNILLYTDFFGDNMQLHTNMPVKVDFLETGNLLLNNQRIEVELVEAMSKIHFINTPMFIVKKVGIFLLLATLFGGYFVWTFRAFLKNVKNGLIFNSDNIKRLKHVAYGLVGFWLFIFIYNRFFYHYIVTQLEFENIRINEDIENYNGILVLALFIWVLAHIFMTGLKLQEDKDLTI